MQKLLEWTLSAIRAERSDFSWMEECRFDWVPLIQTPMRKILQGQSALIFTDSKREWFEKYLLSSINVPGRKRPYVPFYSLKSIFPNLDMIESEYDVKLLEDILEITFPNGYFFWYIGEKNERVLEILHKSNKNFIWSIGEEFYHSFNLRENDPMLDIKLLQLYRLFDRTLEAVIFSEISVK